jgi:hypothetical protein
MVLTVANQRCIAPKLSVLFEDVKEEVKFLVDVI